MTPITWPTSSTQTCILESSFPSHDEDKIKENYENSTVEAPQKKEVLQAFVLRQEPVNASIGPLALNLIKKNGDDLNKDRFTFLLSAVDEVSRKAPKLRVSQAAFQNIDASSSQTLALNSDPAKNPVDALQSKEVIKAKKREWYRKNKEKAKEYRERNKERIRIYNAKRYEKNKARFNASSAEYRERNKDYFKKYRVMNKEKIKVCQATHRKKQKEKALHSQSSLQNREKSDKTSVSDKIVAIIVNEHETSFPFRAPILSLEGTTSSVEVAAGFLPLEKEVCLSVQPSNELAMSAPSFIQETGFLPIERESIQPDESAANFSDIHLTDLLENPYEDSGQLFFLDRIKDGGI